jgi:predicted MFS family arabinose efflux permease
MKTIQRKNTSLAFFFFGWMGFLANGDIYAAAPLLINIAGDLRVDIGTASLSITSYMLAFGLFTLFIGPIGDKVGKTRIYTICAFGTAIFSFVSMLVPDIHFLVVARFIKGAFASGIMPVSMALTGEMAEDSKRHKAIAGLMGMMTLGGASASFIGGMISYFGSWRMVYGVYGLAESILAVLILVFLNHKSGEIRKMNYLSIYSGILKKKGMPGIFMVMILTGFCIFGSFSFSGEMIRERTGWSILVIGLSLSLFGAGGMAGSFIAPFLRRKFGSRISLMAGCFGVISFITVFVSGNPVIFLPAFFILGVTFISLHSTMLLEAQNAAVEMKGSIMSFASFSVFTGSAIGTIIYRQMTGFLPLASIFLIAACLFFITGAIAFFQLNKKGLNGSVR